MMNRREILAALGALTVSRPLPMEDQASPAGPVQFDYSHSIPPEDLSRLLNGKPPRSGVASTPAAPEIVVPIYFDRKSKSFVKPEDVTSDLDAGTYTLQAVLRNANISSGRLSSLKDNNLQIHLSATVGAQDSSPNTLTWLVLNGLDVFGDPKNVKTKLAKFNSGQNNGSTLTGKFGGAQAIEISNGHVDLSIELFGHKKDSWWLTLLSFGKALANTPFFGTIGLPALGAEALQFAQSAISKISDQKQDQLVKLLYTKLPVPYNILKKADPDDVVTLRPGWWCAVTLDTALKTDYLKEYVINYNDVQFDVVPRQGASTLDSDYMVFQVYLNSKVQKSA